MSTALGSLSDRVLLVDKGVGGTSHDVVLRLRRLLGIKRIGHAGTLDPFATGLLLMLVGRATKLFPMLSTLDKEYEGTVRLGVETTSGDPHGDVIAEHPVPAPDPDRIDDVARSLVGEQDQVPPMSSAVKHNGTPLYKLERQGIEVERKSRRIFVERFDIESVSDDEVRFTTRCSKGTYVRTLATEFGRRLGPGGHLTALRRSAIGGCRVEDAVTVDELERLSPRDGLAQYGLSLSAALGALAAVRLNPSGVRKVRCGALPTPADMLDFNAVPEEGQLVQLLDPAGDLVAVGRSSATDPGTPASRIELVRVI